MDGRALSMGRNYPSQMTSDRCIAFGTEQLMAASGSRPTAWLRRFSLCFTGAAVLTGAGRDLFDRDGGAPARRAAVARGQHRAVTRGRSHLAAGKAIVERGGSRDAVASMTRADTIGHGGVLKHPSIQ